MHKALLVALALATALTIKDSSAETDDRGKQTEPAIRMEGTQKMVDAERYWALVNSTIAFESDPQRQITALRAVLSALPAAEIEGFEATFDALMRQSYSWELRDAFYVIHGMVSDDTFEYFRCWLISKGRVVFEKVSDNPDSLADLLSPNSRGPLQFEEFAYVARDVWAEKTGKSFNEMTIVAAMAYPDGPSGVKGETDRVSLQVRYPKLWQRFRKRSWWPW